MSAEAKTIKTPNKLRSQVEQPLVNVARDLPRAPRKQRSQSPLISLLTSTILHLAVIFSLTLVVLRGRGLGPNGFDVITSTNSEISVDQVGFELTQSAPSEAVEPDAEAEQSAAQMSSSSTASSSLSDFAISTSGSIADVTSSTATNFVAVPSIAVGEHSTLMTNALMPTRSPFAGTSLESRMPANRARVAMKNGGTLESEKAVEMALVWLAAHQYADGGWSMNLNDPGDGQFRPACPCNGQCSGSSIEQLDLKRHAATGLALLCFLGAGYTHQEGKYKDNVYRALNFLIATMRDNQEDPTDTRYPGQFSSGNSRHLMYEQGIATFALCEAFQMTKDPILRESCQTAITYVVNAEHYDGSWGYMPRTVGDLSIVGWQIMALRSAASSDLQINRQGVVRMDRFLNTQMSADGTGYGYRSQKPTPTMTAIGMLMRIYRGWSLADPRIQRGMFSVIEYQPSKNDMYFNYYATQAIFYSQSSYWPRWNTAMREYLVSTQSQNAASHELGSWYFDGSVVAQSNAVGGRLYCTAMATLILEVYYRYLPTYKEEANDDFKF